MTRLFEKELTVAYETNTNGTTLHGTRLWEQRERPARGPPVYAPVAVWLTALHDTSHNLAAAVTGRFKQSCFPFNPFNRPS